MMTIVTDITSVPLRLTPTSALNVSVVPRPGLLDSIRDKGILTHIHVTSDLYVIDGKQRVACAKALGIKMLLAFTHAVTEAQYKEMVLLQAVKYANTELYGQALLRLGCPNLSVVELARKIRRNVPDTLRLIWS